MAAAGKAGPRLSRRVLGVVGDGGDDGWGVYYRARSLIAAGEPVVNLTIGDHDTPPAPAILDAMEASARGGHTGYAPVEGTRSLRVAVAARSTAGGLPATAEEVCITCGGQAALFAAMCAVLDPGESAVVIDPFYATYAQTVRAAAGRPVVVPARAEDGFQPDAARIEASLAPDTRAILLNTPNNPTGAVYTAATLDGLADLARRRDLWLISDEVYAAQVWQGRHISPRALPGMAERTLVVDSMSKAYGMTGFRLGWVLGPEAAVARIADIAIATNYGLPGFIQDAAAAALSTPEGAEAARALRALYGGRRRAALDALGAEAGPGWRLVAPEGGMYLLIDIRPTGLSGTAFADRLLDEERIAVMPGESFGTAAAGHLRVALTRRSEALGPALGRIAAMADRLAGEACARPLDIAQG